MAVAACCAAPRPSDPSRPSSRRRARRSTGRTGTRRRAGTPGRRTSWPPCRTTVWPIRRARIRHRLPDFLRGRSGTPVMREAAARVSGDCAGFLDLVTVLKGAVSRHPPAAEPRLFGVSGSPRSARSRRRSDSKVKSARGVDLRPRAVGQRLVRPDRERGASRRPGVAVLAFGR